jgi:hypothetical protein
MDDFDKLKDSVRDMQKKMYEFVTKDEFNVTFNDVKNLKVSTEAMRSDF